MTFLLRATSPALVSWQVFAFAVLGSTQLSLLGSGGSTSGPAGGLALAGALGGVATYAVVALGWLLVLRWVRPRPRVVPALVVVTCAGLARGLAVHGVLVWIGYAAGGSSTLALRLATSVITVPMSLLIAAAGVQAVREYRASIALLTLERQRLTNLLATSTEGMEARQASALAQVRARLNDGLRDLALDSAPSAVTSLESLAGDVVRPLSHSLARDLPQWESDASVEDSRPRLWDVWRRPVAAASIRPFILTLIVLVMALPAAFLAYSPRYGAPAVLVGAGVVLIVLLIGRRTMLRHPPRTALRLWLRLVAILVIAGALASVATSLVETPDESAGVYARVGTVVIPVFGLLVAVISMMAARMQEVTVELTSVTRQLQWALARVQAQQWEQGGQLSRALHGPVQSLIHARLLTLRRQAAAGEISPGLLHGLRGDLQVALESAMSPQHSPRPVADVLRDIEETWAGVATIECRIDVETSRQLDEDPLCTHVLTDLLGEAVSNAIRHGGARHVRVEVERDADDLVLARVIDDGVMSANPSSGLGTTLLARCTYDWSITSDGPTTLVARIPYSPSAPTSGAPIRRAALTSR